MLYILYTIESLYKRYYKNRSKDFIKGFLECLHLFEVGIERHPQYNFVLLHAELEEEVKQLKKECKDRLTEIDRLNNKIFEKSIITKPPLGYFREYNIKLETGELFSIITNLALETCQDMVINFSMRYSWEDINECKGKMLQFINDKNHLGFKAYKDKNQATKDKANIK